MATSEHFDLKKYLIFDFGDVSHRNASLMSIFIYDQNYYHDLLWKGKVDARAAYFFWKKEKALRDIVSKGGYYLKKQEIMKLIDEYLVEEEEEQKKTQNDSGTYLSEEEIEMLLDPESFRCRDMGFQEYEVGIDGKFRHIFDEESLSIVKDAIESYFSDEFITPDVFEDFISGYRVPFKYYGELAQLAVQVNREAMKERQYFNRVVNTYKKRRENEDTEFDDDDSAVDSEEEPSEFEEIEEKKTEDNTPEYEEPEPEEREKVEEQEDDESEDERILLDSYDELAYFTRKNRRDKSIYTEKLVHVMNGGEVKQIEIWTSADDRLRVRQTQGEAIEVVLLEEYTEWAVWRLTIKAIRRGLSILDCSTENETIQMAFLVI